MNSEIRKQVGRLPDRASNIDPEMDALARVWQLRKSLERLGVPRTDRNRGTQIIKQVGRTPDGA